MPGERWSPFPALYRPLPDRCSWQWFCPVTGEVVGPEALPPLTLVWRDDVAFCVVGARPDGPPQFVGRFRSWERAVAACHRWRAALPAAMREATANERRRAWWAATEPGADEVAS